MQILFSIFLVMILFYLVLIMPMQRQNRRLRQMQTSLAPGDEVVTTGGIIGVVREVKDMEVLLEISQGVKARVLRTSITQRLEPRQEQGPEEEQKPGPGQE